jgi:hypothetical protein
MLINILFFLNKKHLWKLITIIVNIMNRSYAIPVCLFVCLFYLFYFFYLFVYLFIIIILVKCQVKLLKPNYLSVKSKQNFKVTQWKWGKVYFSWAPGLTLSLLGFCQSLLGVTKWVFAKIFFNSFQWINL